MRPTKCGLPARAPLPSPLPLRGARGREAPQTSAVRGAEAIEEHVAEGAGPDLLALEAELLQHPDRRGVDRVDAGQDLLERPAGLGPVDRDARHLGRVAAAG